MFDAYALLQALRLVRNNSTADMCNNSLTDLLQEQPAKLLMRHPW